MCPNRNCGGGLFTILAIFCLSILIFYQIIITLIIPLRFNLFILLIEVFLLFYLKQYTIIYCAKLKGSIMEKCKELNLA